jgi:ATP-binding cassette subfamily F protein 3
MIQINNLSKAFGGQQLFQNINLNISPRERLGLVGRNGTGKSTLFKIILDEETADTGEVKIPKNYIVSTLRQHIEFLNPLF